MFVLCDCALRGFFLLADDLNVFAPGWVPEMKVPWIVIREPSST
jgi:hypothetical protein